MASVHSVTPRKLFFFLFFLKIAADREREVDAQLR